MKKLSHITTPSCSQAKSGSTRNRHGGRLEQADPLIYHMVDFWQATGYGSGQKAPLPLARLPYMYVMNAGDTLTNQAAAGWSDELLAEFPFLAEEGLTEPTGMGRPELNSAEALMPRDTGILCKARIELARRHLWS